jgi:hypothetical protein
MMMFVGGFLIIKNACLYGMLSRTMNIDCDNV